MEYKFPLISSQFSQNHQAGWVTDACFALDDGDVDTAKIHQILAKGTKQQINDYFKKLQREHELVKRVADRSQRQRELEEWKVERDRQIKQNIQELIDEAINAPRSKRLATVDRAFKRDNLNQYRRYKSDNHDGVLG